MPIPASFLSKAVLLDGPRADVLEDVMELAARERGRWQSITQMLRDDGAPMASRQYFCELIADPPTANQTQVAAAADTVLWDAANLTAIAAGAIRAGQLFKATAWGITTTAVTAGQSVVVTPRFGTTTGGTALGASRNAPVNAAVVSNAPWFLEMWVHFRTVGASGTATCGGFLTSPTIVGAAGATPNGATLNFGTGGTTATTVNTTAAAGLVATITPSLSTQTYTTLGVALESRC